PPFDDSGAMAVGQYSARVRALVVVDGLECPCGLEPRLDAAAGFACRGALRAPLHHSARLRPRLLLREPPRQSMGRCLPRADHVVSVRLLEEDARRTPRNVRESRSPRVW